jgi:hypothetical protein
MSVSCKEFIGSMMVFKKINDLKGGVWCRTKNPEIYL